MTKRELIDQILHDNPTAEPGFLAQFSDEQLREYLTQLKSLRRSRLRGDASRFDRYFHSCPSVATPSAGWRTDDMPPAAPSSGAGRESLDLSTRSAARTAAPPPTAGPAKPAGSAARIAPPIQELDLDAPLPADAEALERMQLSSGERTALAAPTDQACPTDEPPAEQAKHSEPDTPTGQPPFPDTATEEQTWLF